METQKGAPQSFEELMFAQREQMMDSMARGIAGVQGRPPDSDKADVDDEYTAWTTEDPNVTPEHLQQIAMQTAQEFSQQTNDDGSPLWTPEQIGQVVAARQQAARTPFRHLTYTLGIAEDDIEGRIKKAREVRKRVESRQQKQLEASMTAGGWQSMDPSALPQQGGGMV